jgi:hypothetical protein
MKFVIGGRAFAAFRPAVGFAAAALVVARFAVFSRGQLHAVLFPS